MFTEIDTTIGAAVRRAIEMAQYIDYVEGHIASLPKVGIGNWVLPYLNIVHLYGYEGPLLTPFGIAELTKKPVLVVRIDGQTGERRVTHTITPGTDGEIAEYIPREG